MESASNLASQLRLALKPGNDDNSNYTNSTAGDSGDWSSINSNMGSGVMTAPLNDLGGGSSQLEKNSLVGGSQDTRGSTSNNSWGESSLSSFLSVLLEDEETRPCEILIVPDNPKPEQRSIQDLRLSFIRSAYKNDKPKCRWEYLTRDNNDRDHMSRSRYRSKLEVRSSSFSGAISDTKMRPPSRSNGSSNPNKKTGSSTAASMFLRMPQRKNSPMTEAVQKKSLMSRYNMSDTDLILLPMQPGSGRDRDRSKNINASFSGEPQKQGLSRSGDHKASNGNASWGKTDLRERRRRNSNQFLDFLLEPDGAASSSCWPSPIPSPSPHRKTPSYNAFQISQRQIREMSTTMSFDSSDSEDEQEPSERPLSKPTRPNGSSKYRYKEDRVGYTEKCCSKPPQKPIRHGCPMSPRSPGTTTTATRRIMSPRQKLKSPRQKPTALNYPSSPKSPRTRPSARRKSKTSKIDETNDRLDTLEMLDEATSVIMSETAREVKNLRRGRYKS